MNKTIAACALVALNMSVPQGDAIAGNKCNPLATKEQSTAEQLAALIVAKPEVVAAKQTLYKNWLALAETAAPVSAEQKAYLQEAVDEQAFVTALGVQGTDANYPAVVSLLAAPHSWFGRDVPGSRSVFDNPDTVYWRIPLDPKASYVIRGKRNKVYPVDENYSLWDNKSATISNLTGDGLVTGPDGTFTITLDKNPANGRVNHIQLPSNAASLFVRNTVSDWHRQAFTSLRVERVGGPAVTAPKSFADWVTLVATGVANSANPYPNSALSVFQARAYAQPVNTLPALTKGGTNGTLSSQVQEYSAWQIADDEALIVTVNPGGAKYFSVPIYSRWQITTDYINHTQSLNNTQSKPNPDGTYTFVISTTDPRVYNWVDTAGLHEGLLNLRWQGVPSTPPASGDVAATLTGPVKLADLKAYLPVGTKFVTAKQRTLQLKQRADDYAKRYASLLSCN